MHTPNEQLKCHQFELFQDHLKSYSPPSNFKLKFLMGNTTPYMLPRNQVWTKTIQPCNPRWEQKWQLVSWEFSRKKLIYLFSSNIHMHWIANLAYLQSTPSFHKHPGRYQVQHIQQIILLIHNISVIQLKILSNEKKEGCTSAYSTTPKMNK